jgi:DNA polymerase III delta prime subunit
MILDLYRDRVARYERVGGRLSITDAAKKIKEHAEQEGDAYRLETSETAVQEIAKLSVGRIRNIISDLR